MTEPSRGKIVLGTVQLGQPYGIANLTGQPSEAEALRILRTAERLGVRAFDTAPTYGSAEALIGRSGTQTPVMTKIRPGVDPAESVAASLSAVGRDQVEVLFFHEPSVLTGDGAHLMDRAVDLVGGPVGALGISVYTPEELGAAIELGSFSVVQVPLSVADQRLRTLGLLETAKKAAVEVLVRSTYLQGALLMETDELPRHLAPLAPVIEAVSRMARERGSTRIAVLAGFALSQPAVTGMVVGAETVDQVERTFEEVGAVSLTEAEVDALERLPALGPEVVDPRQWPPARGSLSP